MVSVHYNILVSHWIKYSKLWLQQFTRGVFLHTWNLWVTLILSIFLKVTWNTAYMQHLNSWPCCLPHASFPGSEPRVRWPQQSRDQRCLPARKQSPDLHRWERHQHPAVGGRLGNSIHPTSLIPAVGDQHPLWPSFTFSLFYPPATRGQYLHCAYWE